MKNGSLNRQPGKVINNLYTKITCRHLMKFSSFYNDYPDELVGSRFQGRFRYLQLRVMVKLDSGTEFTVNLLSMELSKHASCFNQTRCFLQPGSPTPAGASLCIKETCSVTPAQKSAVNQNYLDPMLLYEPQSWPNYCR